jgi:hypothetical protein
MVDKGLIRQNDQIEALTSLPSLGDFLLSPLNRLREGEQTSTPVYFVCSCNDRECS